MYDIFFSFKVWHYSGALLHETMWPEGQELLEVVWQSFADGTHKSKPISYEKIDGILSSQPVASSQPYRPPNARGIIYTPLATSSLKQIEDKKKRKNPTNRSQKFKQNKAHQENGDDKNVSIDGSPDNNNQDRGEKQQFSNRSIRPIRSTLPPVDPEKMKRIKAVNKKLNEISKLKERKEKGEHLESNQMSKISSEADLVKELTELRIILKP